MSWAWSFFPPTSVIDFPKITPQKPVTKPFSWLSLLAHFEPRNENNSS